MKKAVFEEPTFDVIAFSVADTVTCTSGLGEEGVDGDGDSRPTTDPT